MINKVLSLFKNNFSKLILLGILFYFLATYFAIGRWEDRNIIIYDAQNYHVYLPATFVYNDLTFSYRDSLNKHFKSVLIPGYETEEGRLVQKMTAGKALMDTPFFLVAHLWATLDSGSQADGYDRIYHLFIGLSGLFYGFFALVYIRKILRQMMPDDIVGVTILLIGCATNLYYYSAFSNGMAHATGLFLIAVFMWQVIQFVDSRAFISLAKAMLAIGLAIIVRPTNAIFGIFLILYIIESGWGVKQLVKDIKNNIGWFILASLAFLAPIFIQLSIWKFTSGHWVYYGYGDEGFFFSSPEIIKGLFSARNGLFLYSPILIFAFIGMLLPMKKRIKYSLAVPLLLFVYTIYSWWCWWYGGSVGSRAAIESYAILAIFLASFLHWTYVKLNAIWRMVLIVPVAVSSVYLMASQSLQAHDVILHWDSMTYRAYWDIFAGKSSSKDHQDLLLEPDYENARKFGEEYINFNELTMQNNTSQPIEISNNITLHADTVMIKCEIWDRHKFINNKEYVKLLICDDSGSYCDTLMVKKKRYGTQWIDIIVPYALPPSRHGQKLTMKYIYLGTTNCYYRDPIVLEKSK